MKKRLLALLLAALIVWLAWRIHDPSRAFEVTLALLVFRVPFGFVAMLGTIALAGMIMRNSVILVDQIDQDIQAGHDRWHAIIDATVRRFRPIVLTALAAVLAMIPLSRSAFFGPMAVAIMGGLTVATVLTLFFLPALYAAWFKVKPEPDTGARGERRYPAGDSRRPPPQPISGRLYTSDAADDRPGVECGGRRAINDKRRDSDSP